MCLVAALVAATLKGMGEGIAVVPGGPLIHEPGAGWIAGFPEDDVQGGVIEVGEVDGEAFGRTEGAAHLLDGAVVAALRLHAGSGAQGDQVVKQARLVVDGMLDIDWVGGAVLPLAEVEGRLLIAQAAIDDGGQELVPVCVAARQPARRGVHDDLLGCVALLSPRIKSYFGR